MPAATIAIETILAELGDLPTSVTPVLADGYAQGDTYEFYATDGNTWDWYPNLDDALEAYSEGTPITLRIYPPDPEPARIFYDDEYGLTVAERNGL
jgi:hypothetical protein